MIQHFFGIYSQVLAPSELSILCLDLAMETIIDVTRTSTL